MFVYVRENQMFPSVSRAEISDILGATCLSVKVPAPFDGTHIRLMKRVPLSQLSSTFIMRLLASRSGSILKAYCYQSTKHLSKLLCKGTVLANLYPIPISFRNTMLISFLETSRSEFSRTAAYI